MPSKRSTFPTTTNPSRFKTASPPLTRDEIVAAALRHANTDGLDQLTLRKLADELDVTPMALYRHVRDKDDILEAVTDVLLAEAGLPDPHLLWSDYLIELAETLRGVLRGHPSVVGVFTRQPQVGPAALARLAGARDVLTRAGLHARPDHPDLRRGAHLHPRLLCPGGRPQRRHPRRGDPPRRRRRHRRHAREREPVRVRPPRLGRRARRQARPEKSQARRSWRSNRHTTALAATTPAQTSTASDAGPSPCSSWPLPTAQ